MDVLVELEEHAVAIEAEFAPARTVIADARKRLPEHPLYWRGLPVACAFTLVYPETLRAVPESQARTQLATCNVLEFSQLFRDEVETQARLFPAAKPTSDTENPVASPRPCSLPPKNPYRWAQNDSRKSSDTHRKNSSPT